MSDNLSSPILDYEGGQEYNPTQDEKTMALLSHILTVFSSFLAPLIIYIIKKDESDFVRDHAIESLNFQISMTIYAIICIPLIFIVIGVFFLMAIGLLTFIFAIVATVKASEGKMYRYPLSIRLIK